MKYKAVIFDLFGTLVDSFTVPEYFQNLDEMAAILQVPPEGFSKIWRDSFYMRTDGSHRTPEESIRFTCNQMGCTVEEERVQQAAETRLAFTLRTMAPRPGTIATIEEIKRRGYKTALISDCSPETPAVWPQTDFKGIFDAAIFSSEAGVKKPDRRIYLMATDQIGVRPGECLYIGDGSSFELTGALEAGMDTVLIRDPGESADSRFIDREEDWEGPRISYLREVLPMLGD